MRRMTCSVVEDLLFDYTDGTLSHAELEAVRVHLAICPNCMELARLCAALPTAVREAEMPAAPPETLEHRPGEARAKRRGESRNRERLIASIAAVAAAAVVVAVLGVVPRAGRDEADGAMSGAVPDAAAPARVGGHIGGSLFGPFHGAWDVLEGVDLWLGDGAAVEVCADDGGDAAIRLMRGSLVAEIGPRSEGARIVVETPGARVIARGTVFAVEVAGDGVETVRVTEGVLEVAGLSSVGVLEVGPGQEISTGEVAPRAAAVAMMAADLHRTRGDEMYQIDGEEVSTGEWNEELAVDAPPDRLVKLARTYRFARRYEAAARVYENLIDAYPSEEIAVNALVALAQMELVFMGRDARAADHFRRYLDLRPRGVLAQVAAAGLADASAGGR